MRWEISRLCLKWNSVEIIVWKKEEDLYFFRKSCSQVSEQRYIYNTYPYYEFVA